jgi:H+/Cl- antiporter ClcA/CBS domain-containing protein
MEPTLEATNVHSPPADDSRRLVILCGLAIVIAFGAAFAAQILTGLIGLVTNLAFYGRLSTDFVSPSANHLGPWVIGVPVIGGLIVGIMARYGSSAIRGHGIPEAMEQVLRNKSRIAPRLTLLKPVSAAIAIGTGGPFGAEGPIIATGGALGSLLGQFLHTTAAERKVLLAAGAAAGMAGTFGSPVSAVLLAVELLLFEYRPRSLIPVSLAAATATGVRIVFEGSTPVFAMEAIGAPTGRAMISYVLLGALLGLVSVLVTRSLYRVEDAFERLPVHWMWWPAIGAVAIGIIGFIEPRTLGVGYDNIVDTVNGSLTGRALLVLVGFKLLSWMIALGSGTSGGTLAPLFTIGGGLGALLGTLGAHAFPSLGIDARIAALVGMAAIFAGASRALLTSVVFAFEATRQPMGLLPLLAGCSASYLVSLLLMEHSIMTERLSRRGAPVRQEYAVDHLDQVLVRDIATEDVIVLKAEENAERVRARIASAPGEFPHQGYPVVSASGTLLGVVTVRDLYRSTVSADDTVGALVTRAPIVIFPENTAREAADQMVRARVGRLPVVERNAPSTVVGIVSRSDLLEAHELRLEDEDEARQQLTFSVRHGLRSRGR